MCLIWYRVLTTSAIHSQLFTVEAHTTNSGCVVLCVAGRTETRMGRLESWREATILLTCCLTALRALGSWSLLYLHSWAWTWTNKVKLWGILLQAFNGGGSNSGNCCHSRVIFSFIDGDITNTEARLRAITPWNITLIISCLQRERTAWKTSMCTVNICTWSGSYRALSFTIWGIEH